MDTTGDEPRKMSQNISGMKNENKEDFDFVKLIDFEHPEKKQLYRRVADVDSGQGVLPPPRYAKSKIKQNSAAPKSKMLRSGFFWGGSISRP